MASSLCSFISLLLVLRPGAWRRFTLSTLSLTMKLNPRHYAVSRRSVNFFRRLKSQFLLPFASFESRTHTTGPHDHRRCSAVRCVVSANKPQSSTRRIPSGKTTATWPGYGASLCLDVLLQFYQLTLCSRKISPVYFVANRPAEPMFHQMHATTTRWAGLEGATRYSDAFTKRLQDRMMTESP